MNTNGYKSKEQQIQININFTLNIVCFIFASSLMVL